MNIQIDEETMAYLKKTGTDRLLIDMVPDMTNSGCGCGKSKKYYTPYIRAVKADERFDDYAHHSISEIDIFLSPKAIEAADDTVKIRLEKILLMKRLEVEGFHFIVES